MITTIRQLMTTHMVIGFTSNQKKTESEMSDATEITTIQHRLDVVLTLIAKEDD